MKVKILIEKKGNIIEKTIVVSREKFNLLTDTTKDIDFETIGRETIKKEEVVGIQSIIRK